MRVKNKTASSALALPKMVRPRCVISADGKKLLENAIPGGGCGHNFSSLVARNTRSQRKIYRRAPLTCIVPAWYG
jgi:hypothetical protein